MPDAHDFHTSSLRVFREVARRGSFTAAGESLGYTQSAVSRQVSTLEAEVGTALFDRLPRGVRLTEPGRCLLAHAEAVLDRLELARRDLADLGALAAGRLRVGAFPTADAVLVPRAIAAFRARYPQVRPALVEGLTAAHRTGLLAGDIDLAVVSTTSDPALDGLDLHHLMDDTVLVALPRAHPLAGSRSLRLAQLADEEWITGSVRLEDTLFRSCLSTGFRPRIGYVVTGWTAKQGFVAAGLGVTLVPRLAAAAVRPDIALITLHADDVPVRQVHAATLRGGSPSPAAAAFRDVLDETVSRLPVPR